MVGAQPVQPDEIPAVQSQDRPILVTGKTKDVFIGDGFARLLRIQSRYDMVAKLAKKFDDLMRKVLIGVESRHGSRGLVCLYRSLGLGFVCVRVGPRTDEVSGPQRRKVGQDVCFGRSLPPVALKRPDGNTRSNDAGFAARNTSVLFDAWPNVRNVEGKPLKQLRPLSLAQHRELGFQLFERHVVSTYSAS